MPRGVRESLRAACAFQLEHRLRGRDGEYRWVVTGGVPRYDADKSFIGYIGTSVDITERKLAEGILFSQKLVDAHEEERRRIARELRDHINQRLAVVSMRLGVLKEGPEPSATEFKRRSAKSARRLRILRPTFKQCRTRTFSVTDAKRLHHAF